MVITVAWISESSAIIQSLVKYSASSSLGAGDAAGLRNETYVGHLPLPSQ